MPSLSDFRLQGGNSEYLLNIHIPLVLLDVNTTRIYLSRIYSSPRHDDLAPAQEEDELKCLLKTSIAGMLHTLFHRHSHQERLLRWMAAAGLQPAFSASRYSIFNGAQGGTYWADSTEILVLSMLLHFEMVGSWAKVTKVPEDYF